MRRWGVGLLFAMALVASAQSVPLAPSGVAYDAAGNLYFADANRHQVYESSLAGVLSIVAGTGVQGFGGDGGAATSAQLNSPQAVAVGADGTLYIADTGNQRIRAVSAGVIRTLAGAGASGNSGDGGAALAATFRSPNAIALEPSGSLLICDSGDHRLRRISGSTITAVAGSGVQGFSGDGGSALNAAFDTPTGVAVNQAGIIYLADSHNDRIRRIDASGAVSTVAGTGQRGFSGDGGPATLARLSMPRGLVVLPDGSVVFADSNNQRVRMIDAAGTISTIAGDGVQGTSTDGSVGSIASLDSPRGVAISALSAPVFADLRNRVVRVLQAGTNLYLPAGLAPARHTSISLTTPVSIVYGQAAATIRVTGSAGTPQGTVQLTDGSVSVASATLAGGAVTLLAPGLAAGSHALTASYAGDGLNPAATSTAVSLAVQPALLIASANAASILYGQSVPALSGTLTGVLTQDTGLVSASFSTTAADLSPAATYPIAATLTGPSSSNYSVSLSPSSGALTIAAAPVSVAVQASPVSYTGLPVVVGATVSTVYRGTPSGTVNFLDGGTVVASATLSGGSASASFVPSTVGTHSIVAAYQGSGNFLAATSNSSNVSVNAMPDFGITPMGSAVQTVQAGLIATYMMSVNAQPGPFTGAVVLSASNVPVGAVVTFSPAQIVPGSGSVPFTMSVQTTLSMAGNRARGTSMLALAFSLIPLLFLRRIRRDPLRLIATWTMLIALMASTGCGARTLSSTARAGKSYSFSVSGTGTNLASAVVVRSTAVTLNVQ